MERFAHPDPEARAALRAGWGVPEGSPPVSYTHLAVAFIAKNGGWQGGCSGHCASCQQRCTQQNKKDEEETKSED